MINELFFCRLWKESWALSVTPPLIQPTIISSTSGARWVYSPSSTFDNAMELVTRKHWDGAMFNNSEVHSRFQWSLSDEVPSQDYKEVHKIATGSQNTLRSSPVTTELRFMFKHTERKSHEIIFWKCCLASCDHCSSNPIVSLNAWEYMKDRDFKWPNLMPSAKFPNHLITFLEVPNVDNNSLKTGDEGMPYSSSIGSCPYCQSFIFFSPTEKDRYSIVIWRVMEIKCGKRTFDDC